MCETHNRRKRLLFSIQYYCSGQRNDRQRKCHWRRIFAIQKKERTYVPSSYFLFHSPDTGQLHAPDRTTSVKMGLYIFWWVCYIGHILRKRGVDRASCPTADRRDIGHRITPDFAVLLICFPSSHCRCCFVLSAPWLWDDPAFGLEEYP